MARLNMATSRVRPAICSFVRIDQTCFGRRGGFAPINLPLFQGSRREACGMASVGSYIVGSSVTEGHQDVLVGCRSLNMNMSFSMDLAAACIRIDRVLAEGDHLRGAKFSAVRSDGQVIAFVEVSPKRVDCGGSGNDHGRKRWPTIIPSMGACL